MSAKPEHMRATYMWFPLLRYGPEQLHQEGLQGGVGQAVARGGGGQQAALACGEGGGAGEDGMREGGTGDRGSALVVWLGEGQSMQRVP